MYNWSTQQFWLNEAVIPRLEGPVTSIGQQNTRKPFCPHWAQSAWQEPLDVSSRPISRQEEGQGIALHSGSRWVTTAGGIDISTKH